MVGKHLPKFMRDFHDQKSLFKGIEHTYGCADPNVSWEQNHIFVIDYFLWFMAQHGYTLQKIRCGADKQFDDINKTLDSFVNDQQKEAAKVLKKYLNSHGDR